jgi:hypothetical protein
MNRGADRVKDGIHAIACETLNFRHEVLMRPAVEHVPRDNQCEKAYCLIQECS